MRQLKAGQFAPRQAAAGEAWGTPIYSRMIENAAGLGYGDEGAAHPVAPEITTPSWDFGNIPIHPPDRANRPYARSTLAAPPVPGLIQPKLAVGHADDPLEHEADRIADQVLRMRRPDVEMTDDDAAVGTRENYRSAWPAPSLPAVASGSERVWRQEDAPEQDDDTVEDVDGLLVQRAEHLEAGTCGLRAVPAQTQVRLDSTRGRGEPLTSPLRRFFEPRLGHDLSRVRIYADDTAAELSRDLHAKAFTIAGDIYFAQGQFQTRPGRLLAHELVHTLQQNGLSSGGVELAAGQERATLLRRQPIDAPETPATAEPQPSPPTPCPTSVMVGAVTHRNHGDQSQADQEKFRTYLSARAAMNVGPGPDHTGHCMKEQLTLVSNNCPAAVYTRKNVSGDVVESQPCSGNKCLDIDRFGSGKTAFIDEHRTKVPESVLEGTGKTSCTVVCEQVYTCDRRQPTTGKFQITRNYQAGTAKRADGTSMHVTTGRVDKK
jgi:hypothetical protein